MEKIRKERPDTTQLDALGIHGRGEWECEPSHFSWEYDERETCYVFQGRVTVRTSEGDVVDIGPGDLVVFPKGMACEWTVHERIRKVYRFG
jgi:uncharacterized cupin superfamily protein